MSKTFKTMVLGGLSSLSVSVLAHTGHGEHLASSDYHPMLSVEHLLLISGLLVAYWVFKRS